MKIVPVEEAVGMVLCHDMTRIVPGESKGPAFRKGHIVAGEDVQLLLEIGKEHVCVLDLAPGQVHEDEAALRIARAAAGPGITLSQACEGRVNFEAERGLLDVNVEALNRINSIEEVVLATMHDGQQITEPRAVAGTRVVPLVIDEEKIERAEALCAEYPYVVGVRPFKHHKVGLVTTGSEVYHGRITDRFGPVIREKFSNLGSTIMDQRLSSDDPVMTRDAILAFIAEGAEMVMVTGGMSVDPDDQTPTAIRATGAEIITYGSPTFPGAMFMIADLSGVPILGLPGCVMYYRASVFDLVVPRLLAGEKVTREDVVTMGHGGFCATCEVCRYPICPFGK
ncbi:MULTISPECIES: molybdopterin-binding protein [unclassified Pseudodesulfovibrio]|uniref:molybdopterin-binding protein n=1 Tax=unclassified Pseudodesulfovibrio TaxID=2661612 RepID=UPI000FEB8D51|nr:MULTISPECIES: molybdopterin-binding protein [unclassified Pseudodesulfovibrio]MCJ2164569.1 molybdopterin-binding protein [Pseudodesulfovibrio sp. S3-i]RWU04767.1 molybdopterin-binding protein [Pseudodesulfovibrio sp. S3]